MNSLAGGVRECRCRAAPRSCPISQARPDSLRDRPPALSECVGRISNRPNTDAETAFFENCIVVNSPIGGSTNAQIHINALADHIGRGSAATDWQKRFGRRFR